MQTRSVRLDVLLTLAAVAAVLVGGFIRNHIVGDGMWAYIPAVLIGVGASLFGISAARFAILVMEDKDPDLRRKTKIDAEDERNIAISNLAKGKAFDLFGPVFGALMVVYALTGVELPSLLLLVGCYLAVFAFRALWLVRYQNRL